MISVLVHGMGTIGKRVAYSVNLQKDMKLYGVANRSINTNIRNFCGDNGPLKGINIYSSSEEGFSAMKNSGFNVKGTLEDALSSGKVDVIVDCTPAGVEAQYKPIYEKYKVKMIFQGGAGAEIADMSFNADANYEKAINKSSVRIVSCNTTSLIRTTNALNKFELEEVFAFLVRRAVDPPDDKKGPVNSTVPVVHTPSHHGPDVKTVVPSLNITTMAAKVPVTTDHCHHITAKLRKRVSEEEVVKAFENANRIVLFREKDGYTSTALIEEHFRDINRPRGDMYEVAVWEDSVKVENGRVYWIHAVHSEAIVIPENIDAIRAITGEKDKEKSIKMTNKSLGIE